MDRIALVHEVAICQYLVVIHTPRLCGEPLFVHGGGGREGDRTGAGGGAGIQVSAKIECRPVVYDNGAGDKTTREPRRAIDTAPTTTTTTTTMEEGSLGEKIEPYDAVPEHVDAERAKEGQDGVDGSEQEETNVDGEEDQTIVIVLDTETGQIEFQDASSSSDDGSSSDSSRRRDGRVELPFPDDLANLFQRTIAALLEGHDHDQQAAAAPMQGHQQQEQLGGAAGGGGGGAAIAAAVNSFDDLLERLTAQYRDNQLGHGTDHKQQDKQPPSTTPLPRRRRRTAADTPDLGAPRSAIGSERHQLLADVYKNAFAVGVDTTTTAAATATTIGGGSGAGTEGRSDHEDKGDKGKRTAAATRDEL
jgi:hypothetical protein